MTTATLAPVQPVAESLAALDRAARDLERQKLRTEARLRLDEIREALDQLRAALGPPGKTPTREASFDAEAAGRRLVAQLQTAEGGAWTGGELQSQFGLTPAVLHRRRKEHRIVYWRDARHEFRYPRWQFTPTGALLPGIQEVLQTFRSHDEWRIMSYFLGQRSQLNTHRPLDLLRSGDTGKVLDHARQHAPENTW